MSRLFKTLFILGAFSAYACAHAAYRCEDQGKVTYSDAPCGSQARPVATTPAPSDAEVRAAQRAAAQDKREANQAVKARRAEQERDFRAQQRAERNLAKQRKHCDKLAQRAKWAKEDADKGGTVKAMRKADSKRKRAEETYAMDCKG